MKVQSHGESGGNFEPVSDGEHQAVIAEFVDLGYDPNAKYTKHQGVCIMQVDEHNESQDGEEIPKEVWAYFDVPRGLGVFKPMNGKKTALRELVEAITGEMDRETFMRFSPAEKGGDGEELDLDKLVGAPLRVVTQTKRSSNDRQYAKPISFLKHKKGAEPLKVQNYTPYDERDFDGDENNTDFDYGSNQDKSSNDKDEDFPWKDALG